jgi:hypothetical protein
VTRDPGHAHRADWPDHLPTLRPTVLLLGGFLTAPPFYRPMVRRLYERGVARVVVADIWTPDWVLAGLIGLGRLMRHADDALERAVAASASSPASRGAPLLVIGHSAGGIVARLLTSGREIGGRRYDRADAMGAIVTLGTPHHLDPRGGLGRRLTAVAVRAAERSVPGAFHAPRVGYVAVASTETMGRPDGDGRARVAYRLYQGLRPDPANRAIAGDGMVPVPAALLAGARHVVLDDVVHGQAAGRPWYGTDRGLDGWWDAALQAWHEALEVRARDPRSAAGAAPRTRTA